MKIKPILLGFIMGVVFVMFLCHQSGYYNGAITITTTDTVHDTVPVFIKTPLLRDSVVIRYATVSIPVYDTVHIDTIHAADSIRVTVPITQKVYKDSTYEAWVSGYMPALDSIRISQPVSEIIHHATKYKTKRWGFGIQTGVGITPHNIQPYVGIGVSYNLFSW